MILIGFPQQSLRYGVLDNSTVNTKHCRWPNPWLGSWGQLVGPVRGRGLLVPLSIYLLQPDKKNIDTQTWDI